MKLPIPYGQHQVTDEDIEAVVRVLRSDRLTQGPVIKAFEDAVAEYCGARYAVATSNATSALHLAAEVAGVKAHETLWTSCITFVASANCALYCGGRPDFVDIDPGTGNLGLGSLREKLEKTRRAGEKLPAALVAVHLAGAPCEMAPIRELSTEYGFRVIEDASHALGATYRGTKVGSGAFSDFTVFSFHAVKNVACGEGGMILTNDPQRYVELLELRNHGITRDPARMSHSPEGPWYYEQNRLGHNYRLSDIHAALGLSQFRRLDEMVRERRRLARRYETLLTGLPLWLPREPVSGSSAWHLYVVRLGSVATRRHRREIFEAMREAGIEVNLHYIPVVKQPYYERLGHRIENFPEALRYYEAAMTLPLFVGLAESEQNYVAGTLRRLISLQRQADADEYLEGVESAGPAGRGGIETGADRPIVK